MIFWIFELMSNNYDNAKGKWTQAWILRRVGMKESYLIVRNAWFTSDGLMENNLEFLTDDFLR